MTPRPDQRRGIAQTRGGKVAVGATVAAATAIRRDADRVRDDVIGTRSARFRFLDVDLSSIAPAWHVAVACASEASEQDATRIERTTARHRLARDA